MPRLPRSYYTIAALSVLLIAAIIHIRNLQGALAAKPTVQDRIITKTIQGPTKTEVRTIVKPGGERIEERIVYVESKTTERENEHSEAPQGIKLKTRYAGVRVDLLDYERPTLRAGLTVWGTYDLGATFDTRNMRPGIEAAWRF